MVCLTVDEHDASNDVTRYYVIIDHVVYEDEFIQYVTEDDEVDAGISSEDDDRDYEELMLSKPVRLNFVLP